MKDNVTFETAVRLKEAGFPQPKPDFGQVWHNPDFGLFVVGAIIEGAALIFYEDGDYIFKKEVPFFQECAFAPTATDILRELPGCILSVEDFYRDTLVVGLFYEVWKTGRLLSDHANPAESAADAWLKLNPKIKKDFIRQTDEE